MDSPLPIARPWTPPDTDAASSPRSDYFSDPFRPASPYSAHFNARFDAHMEGRCDTPTEAYRLRPKMANHLTEPAPYTPTKNLNYIHAASNGALQYPYTPDSSRMLRRHTDAPSSPAPWDEYSEHSSSPVQNALSSCIAHFENLIQSQQPDEDQMEFIVRQFEAMTSYLSAPDSQTRTTDEHLFSEPENAAETGLGISEPAADRVSTSGSVSIEAHGAYVAEVEAYLQGVKKYISDLAMRLDEVKTLNSIQFDVITDLRRQMKTVRSDMRSSLDMRSDMNLVDSELARLQEQHERDLKNPQKEFGVDSWVTLVDDEDTAQAAQPNLIKKALEPEPQATTSSSPPKRRVIHIVRKPERRSFWASFGQALDSFGAQLHGE
ncbi:hypothetical protein DE146DRAFT_525617 [Phaeosphaeria sp. MPI-PUGE-AT-0046c]|nr:hypothetical protein DE146DRAFT_525617 [Phaeosphaeria sp. MPI-PUGE-AT-0046c]